MTSGSSGAKSAVVIGGSMGGLLAARVLSDHFGQVTVIERDTLPEGPAPRKGVPQCRHLHGFLAGGVSALSELFPNFLAGAQARGGLSVDVGRLGRWYMTGALLPDFDSGLRGLLISRLAIEAYVRELVRARTNVTFLEGHRVTGLLGGAERIHGLRIDASQRGTAHFDPAQSERTELTLAADLVVDASGRGSRAVQWLAQHGVQAPPEERVRADITISSCTIRRKPHHLAGAHAWIYSPTPPGLTAGAALAMEGDRYIIAMTAYLGAAAPRSYGEMIAFAKNLPVRGLDALLEDAEPLSEPAVFQERESRRRRFEAIAGFPQGMLVLADALCSFNPSYGQGITIAAKQAQLLDTWLRRGMRGGPHSFFRDAARLIDVPWSTIVAGDLQWPAVQGKRTLRATLMASLFKRLVRSAQRDHESARALLSVLHLVAPPSALLSPRLIWSLLEHGGAPRALPTQDRAHSAPAADGATPAPMTGAR